MNAVNPLDKTFRQLPMVHQIRDAESDQSLRGLMQIIQQQILTVENNIGQLYRDAFIETCQPWVVPYIGDLAGIGRPAADTLPDEELSEREAARQRLLFPRGEVGRAVDQYRRKGTLAVLEKLSNLVATWPARAVEFYPFVAQTQTIKDPHPDFGRLANLNNAGEVDLIGGPFNEMAHLPDIRAMNPGHDGIPFHPNNVGLYVWRLKSYSITRTKPKCLCDKDDLTVYTFNPMGLLTQLFNKPVREGRPTSIADEINLPAPIRLEAFRDKEKPDQASALYYGRDRSLSVNAKNIVGAHEDGHIARQNVIPLNLGMLVDNSCGCEDGGEKPETLAKIKRKLLLVLDPVDEYRRSVHLETRIGIDPVNGLLVIPTHRIRKPDSVLVSFHYGMSSDIGGGEYRRKLRYQKPVEKSKRVRVRCADKGSCKLDGALARFAKKFNQVDLMPVWLFEHSKEEASDTLPMASLNPWPDSPGGGTPLTGTIEQDRPGDGPGVRIDGQVEVQARNGCWATTPEFPFREANPITLFVDGKEHSRWQPLQHNMLDPEMERVVLEISDSGVYELSELQTILVNRNQTFEIRSTDKRRPLINVRQMSCESGLKILLGPGATLTLDGIAVMGGEIEVGSWSGLPNESELRCIDPYSEQGATLNIRDCTLRPNLRACDDECACDDRSSRSRCNSTGLKIDLPDGMVRIEKSIVGSLRFHLVDHRNSATTGKVAELPTRLAISDSIIQEIDDSHHEPWDIFAAEIILRARRTTFLDSVFVREIDIVEDCIFNQSLTVKRCQTGGVRYSFVPNNSITPPRYYCQPDLAVASEQAGRDSNDGPKRSDETIIGNVKPKFVSTCYGEASFGQLAMDCPEEIREGAEDGSEMGAFHDLYQPQRAANLRSRLNEFTPVSLNTQIIYVN